MGSMKKVEAIVRMERFNEVREALHNVGITGLTCYGINGAGMQNGAVQKNRKPGSWDTRELVRKTKLEVVCDDSSVDKVITAIVDSAKTGNIGDGKIFVFPLDNAIRIRTGETHGEAI